MTGMGVSLPFAAVLVVGIVTSVLVRIWMRWGR